MLIFKHRQTQQNDVYMDLCMNKFISLTSIIVNTKGIPSFMKKLFELSIF